MRRPERVDLSDLFRGSASRLIVEADLWNDDVRDDDLYIPYRTLLFYAAAAARAQTVGILDIYTGFINSNHAKEIDCTAEFMNKLDRLTDAIGPVRFTSPFRHSSKTEVVQEAIRLGVPIGRTFSCQASSKLPCGACPNCVERLGALRQTELSRDASPAGSARHLEGRAPVAEFASTQGVPATYIVRRSTYRHTGALLADAVLQAGLNYRSWSCRVFGAF